MQLEQRPRAMHELTMRVCVMTRRVSCEDYQAVGRRADGAGASLNTHTLPHTQSPTAATLTQL